MTDPKRFFKKILFPPISAILFLLPLCAVALIHIFLNGMEKHPLSYAVYVLSFYTLVSLCLFCAMILPYHLRLAKKKIYDNEYGNRYMTDAFFRTHLALYASFGANVLYGALNLFSALLFKANWFYILASYYAILAIMRFLLLTHVKYHEFGMDMLSEWKRARVCAFIFTLINSSLVGAVFLMMYYERGFKYYGVLIYVMAAYTFYTTVHALIGVIKYRKYQSPVLMSAKLISLASALVSVLALETAMLSAFGTDMSVHERRVMIGATGFGICLLVTVCSVCMLVRSGKEIRKLTERADNA